MTNNGYYNDRILGKFKDALTDAVKGVQNGEYMTVKFSGGNSKMGAVPSVSTLPFITCPSVCSHSCGEKCYAAKLANMRPNVLKNYAINTALAIHRPDLYWTHINDFVKGCRFFRFHVSGDILNLRYLCEMVQVAKENPNCEFLCFTKRYNTVNNYINGNGELPANLHILFSGWIGLKPVNPFNLPETNVFTCENDFNDDWKVCGGNCFNCACRGVGCWQATKGDVIAFKMH